MTGPIPAEIVVHVPLNKEVLNPESIIADINSIISSSDPPPNPKDLTGMKLIGIGKIVLPIAVLPILSPKFINEVAI